jgi:polysaccharide pyruvyl transferase WcaK-like protein
VIIPSIKCDKISYHLAPQNIDVGSALTKHMIKKCDLCIDFTGGDSFTDIYGEDRFYRNTLVKNWIIQEGKPLILGSQTYGPFKDTKFQKEARQVLLKSEAIFARDEISAQYVKDLSGKTAVTTTDVAFMLPYEKNDLPSEKIKVGFNISGLLWEGGYTRDNQFGLTVDYRKYCNHIIEYFLERKDTYELYIIPHVFGNARKGVYLADDDIIPCKYIRETYHDVTISPYFKTAMDAKSYIQSMDLFIGARMHSTIAAFSSYVATIPFSYSRKFEGLYNSLNYPYVIKGTVLSTEEAVNKTEEYIENYMKLQECVEKSMNLIVNDKNELLKKEMSKVILKFVKK